MVEYKHTSYTPQRKGESDQQYYKRLSKTVDQRLQRLEELEGTEHFENVTSYSYANAVKALNQYAKQEYDFDGDLTRFNRTELYGNKQLINAMEVFLRSPTSTKADIINVYKKRAEKFNATMRSKDPNWVDFTWQEMANFWEETESGSIDYGKYMSYITQLNLIKRQKEQEIIQAIQTDKVKDLHLSKSKVDNAVIKNLVEQGISPDSLITKVAGVGAKEVKRSNKNVSKDISTAKSVIGKAKTARKIIRLVKKVITKI